MMLLRGLFFYSSLQIIMAASLVVLLANSPRDWVRFKKDTLLVSFIVVSFVYWISSVMMSNDYSSNFRVLELCLAAANVRMLAGYRSYLATRITGDVVRFALPKAVPYDAVARRRFNSPISNPIARPGLSADLLPIADRGQWILMHRRPAMRTLINLLLGSALVLSTSRGSWLVTIVCLLVILLCNPRARGPMLGTLAVFAVLVAGILQTERGPIIMHYVDNAVGGRRSTNARTGRADHGKPFLQSSMPHHCGASALALGKGSEVHQEKEDCTTYLLIEWRLGLGAVRWGC
jgi:hypothetical protein